MNTNTIDFLLTPDGTSARKVKRALAGEAPGLNRLVGTWPELMAQAKAAYLLPQAPDDWPETLKQAAARQKDAFWASSMEVAPRETIAELDATLNRILGVIGPGTDWKAMVEKVSAESRIHKRLSDLMHLLAAIQRLPAPIQEMADLLYGKDPPHRALRVYSFGDSADFNAWQLAVLNKLKNDAPPPVPELQSILETSLSSPETHHPALKAVRSLFSSRSEPPSEIDGVRVIAVRDSLAEVEITAGFVQKALDNDNKLSDFGLLLPGDVVSLMSVENVFTKCGIPLSGFRRPIGQRDLGRETLRQFLLCLRKPAPLMAIAALLTGPMMPWSMEEGHAMAQSVMGGDVLLKSTRIPKAAHKLMDLIDEGPKMPRDVEQHLNRLNALLSPEEIPYDHLHRFRETSDLLKAALAGMESIDWEQLLNLAAPQSLKTLEPSGYWEQGLPVFHEDSLPWCAVRHLFVLGFNDGQFPAGAGTSAVFNEAEWEQIAAFGWPVETNDIIRKRQRDLFATQLASATESLTLLLSRRDAGGQPLEPSSSLVFLTRSLGVEPDDLVLDLDRSEDRQQISDIPLASPALPSVPRTIPVSDIELKTDLLKAFSRREDALAPLSPSAAETLMVSPFGWLLRRLDCEPREWQPDNFDVMTAGTLAHRVFEELFLPGQPLPAEETIAEKVPKILNQRVLQIAPFLRSSDWRVERHKFESEVVKAAVHWKKLLTSCNATVVAAEQWLKGQHGEVPLHGQSDLLVELSDGKLLVVDYKKSSSGKRRDRMRSGFDLQAHLYRVMIQTGGLPGFESPPTNIGIVYYLLNDTTALTDSTVSSDGTVPGWEVISTDISSQAMQQLDKRIAQIRSGIVRLNTADDEKWWDTNASLPVYALENSPLLRLFMHGNEVSS